MTGRDADSAARFERGLLELGQFLMDFDEAALMNGLARVMPDPTVIRASARSAEGVAELLSWLEARRPVAVAGEG